VAAAVRKRRNVIDEQKIKRMPVAGWGRFERPFRGESVCGDATVVRVVSNRHVFLLADGLGHGPDASRSARLVASTVAGLPSVPLRDLFFACELALRGERGVAMSALDLGPAGATFAGVGNVELYGPPSRPRPMSVPGVLGRPGRMFREQTIEVRARDRWVLASDGLRARDMSVALEATAALDPAAAAARLVELAGREDDDASVLVIDFGAPA
jgi:hypothetical protein